MKIESAIREKLVNEFAPTQMSLENESHMHNFSRGLEGHFKLVIVSEGFHGLRSVERHQKIFSLLKDEMATIHALTVKALTPDEYAKDESLFQSPPCHNRG